MIFKVLAAMCVSFNRLYFCLPLFVAVIRLNAKSAETNEPTFDGDPWHVSTGNLSVMFIQASPIGAFPRPGFIEAPPSLESLVHLKKQGLVANEDYLAWG